MNDTSLTSRWASFRTKSRALRTRQAAPQSGTADQATDIAPLSPEASKTAESGNAAQEPLTAAAPLAEPIPTDAASPELDQAVFAKAAELGRQPGFQANATHLELAYRVHRILVAARQGELVIPHGVDREAVHRFVDEVFFATQFLDEDVHSQAKARASCPNAAQQRHATGALAASEDPLVNIGPPPGDDDNLDVEARRIAGELVKLHKAGAIKSEQDAAFYARLIRDFGAAYIGKITPAEAESGKSEGNPPAGVYVPGKPYTPTEAQGVKIPRGLSRKQEAEFLARDLEEALAYEPTAEELGESVIDLTGGAASHGEVQQDGHNHR